MFHASSACGGSEANGSGFLVHEHGNSPASPQDDTITDQEVAAYEALGRRLRGIAQPTLAEFRAANDIKETIDFYARMAAEPAR